MNMKLFTILSVAIALVSALTFVSLYKKSQTAPAPASSTVSVRPYQAPIEIPSPTITEGGSSTLSASARIGNPGEVPASVKIGG